MDINDEASEVANRREKRRRERENRSVTRRIWRRCVVLCALCMFPALCDASFSVVMDVEDQECYSFRVPDRPSVVSGNFDCWEETGTRLRECRNVAAWIETHSGKGKDVWRSQSGASEEIFDVPVEGSQRYRLCFESAERESQNREDDAVATSVQIGFNVRVKSAVQRALPDAELGPETLRALEVLEAASGAEQQWQNLLDHFDNMRIRENFHSNMSKQIENRVMGWSIVESILVVVMAVAQVWYWKSFFEQRRYL